MDLRIQGKKALVTGASAGLGEAAATALAAEGVRVVINSRDTDRLKVAADRIDQATGNRPAVVAADVASLEGRQAVIEAAGAAFDSAPIDILVSNAGGPPPGAFLDHEAGAWEAAGRLVLDSAIGLTRAVLPGMIERSWGRLIYITSIGVLQPVDTLILSNTYRAGVTGFCKTVSNNYAKYGITANCVCPGYTATERLQNLAGNLARDSGRTKDQVFADIAAQIPTGRVGQPEELAALIAFLAGERAAYITGTSVAVDGGAHRGLL